MPTKTERERLRTIRENIRKLSREQVSSKIDVNVVSIQAVKEEKTRAKQERKALRQQIREEKIDAKREFKEKMLTIAETAIQNKSPEAVFRDISSEKKVFIRFLKRELRKGIDYERSLDMKVNEARKIALANLMDDPHYYQKLEREVMGSADEGLILGND